MSSSSSTIAAVRETKSQEGRVGLTPAGVAQLVATGHRVLVEKHAGAKAGHSDASYVASGAELVDQETAWGAADLVVKVKEPIPSEYRFFRDGLTLFTYLHLSSLPDLTRALVDARVTAIAYESVSVDGRTLPLLAPMSEIAGRIAPQVSARFMLAPEGGPGVLLGGATGVAPSRVTVIGAGVVGANAAKIALGLGAHVRLLDVSVERLAQVETQLGGRVECVMSSASKIEESVVASDLVIGAVLLPGARAPRLVSEDVVKAMRPGALLCDVAVDQGGCFETTRPTSHADPVYLKHDVIHYAVTNIPGSAPVTATAALTNATFPFVRDLATSGVREALASSPALRNGLTTANGKVTAQAVASEQGYDFVPGEEAL